jgi:hypothetical protein
MTRTGILAGLVLTPIQASAVGGAQVAVPGLSVGEFGAANVDATGAVNPNVTANGSANGSATVKPQ